MAKLRSIAMLMALGLTGAAWAAQTPPPPAAGDAQAAPPTGTEPESTQSPDPQSASSPHQRDVTKQPATEATPNASPDPDAASSPHQKGTVGETPHAGMAGREPKVVGLEVQSPSGQALGSVVDVTMDAQRMPEYAVISTGSDTMTAVPYKTVVSMIKGNKVIFDKKEPFSDVPHLENFLSCIKSGKRPACDVEDGHRSTLLAHLGNISYRVGRPLKFDGKTEKFVDDDKASALLKRPGRKGFEIPEKV